MAVVFEQVSNTFTIKKDTNGIQPHIQAHTQEIQIKRKLTGANIRIRLWRR
jgi:hypothetical protein